MGWPTGRCCRPRDLAALADLPPREVLLARLAGAMAAPMQQMAGLLQALPRNLAYGIAALIEPARGRRRERRGRRRGRRPRRRPPRPPAAEAAPSAAEPRPPPSRARPPTAEAPAEAADRRRPPPRRTAGTEAAAPPTSPAE